MFPTSPTSLTPHLKHERNTTPHNTTQHNTTQHNTPHFPYYHLHSEPKSKCTDFPTPCTTHTHQTKPNQPQKRHHTSDSGGPPHPSWPTRWKDFLTETLSHRPRQPGVPAFSLLFSPHLRPCPPASPSITHPQRRPSPYLRIYLQAWLMHPILHFMETKRAVRISPTSHRLSTLSHESDVVVRGAACLFFCYHLGTLTAAASLYCSTMREAVKVCTPIGEFHSAWIDVLCHNAGFRSSACGQRVYMAAVVHRHEFTGGNKYVCTCLCSFRSSRSVVLGSLLCFLLLRKHQPSVLSHSEATRSLSSNMMRHFSVSVSGFIVLHSNEGVSDIPLISSYLDIS